MTSAEINNKKMLEIPSCLIKLLFTNLYYVKVTKDEDLAFFI
ncbi:hypothetical protein CHCC14809_1227 [Bacillus licheniformis]|nr:hypothetical protein B4090_3811 [Bacillus licheniformis]KYC84459.1 hypothetical protein B4091_3789 [Bacillus licheniformis]OLF91451.1 hypothetical protein B4089_2390 [Bacillus licheniformis]OLF94047.1 hypothetical protein B4094_2002 [Bacillus licheniformis]OLG03910.1 hypothetical protein B4124_1830 [Bacillus licheniformis]